MPEVVPGPSAVSAALAVSGIDADRYIFEGFLPRKGSERTKRLKSISEQQLVSVIFEAPHRIERTLRDLVEVCGSDRPICVARELTKLHEEIIHGSLGEALKHFQQNSPKGEFVLIIGRAPAKRYTEQDLAKLLEAEISRGLTKKDAVSSVSETTGESKRQIYQIALTV